MKTLIGAIAALAALAAGAASGGGAPPPPPNVVVLMTDDQAFESMKVMVRTQRLLGGEGVTFDNFFVSYSLCCPSRSTFLTGQYAHNHGVLGNQPPDGGYYKLDSSSTLAVWLQRGGYYTGHIGKYLNGYGTRNQAEIPPGWSEWHGSVDPSTYQYDGYKLNEGGTVTTYCADKSPACYQTDVYAEKAEDFILRRGRSGQPFFLWVAFLANHSGGPKDADDPAGLATPSPAPRHRDAFAATPLPTSPSFDEADVSDKPASIRRRPLLSDRDIAAIRENYQQRLETLLGVDEAVEGIVGALRAAGQLERTLIVFTSDNGFFHGEHRVRSGKVLVYEPSIHVPLIVRGPGVPRGEHRGQLVSNIDLAPTILQAADVAPGRKVDGRPLWPLIRDRGVEWGRDLLFVNGPGENHFDAIRTRDWKYVEHATGERELYDLAGDPDELQSLHADQRYTDLRASLAGRLAKLRTCSGQSCREGFPASLVVKPGGCARRFVTATAGGDGVRRVSFFVDGRLASADGRAPFRAVISLRGLARGDHTIRARVAASFDRLETLDQTVRLC